MPRTPEQPHTRGHAAWAERWARLHGTGTGTGLLLFLLREKPLRVSGCWACSSGPERQDAELLAVTQNRGRDRSAWQGRARSRGPRRLPSGPVTPPGASGEPSTWKVGQRTENLGSNLQGVPETDSCPAQGERLSRGCASCWLPSGANVYRPEAPTPRGSQGGGRQEAGAAPAKRATSLAEASRHGRFCLLLGEASRDTD